MFKRPKSLAARLIDDLTDTHHYFLSRSKNKTPNTPAHDARSIQAAFTWFMLAFQ
jgi:hypothetical protein